MKVFLFHPGKSSPFFTTSWEMCFFASGLFKSKIQVQDGRLTQQLRPGPFAVFSELTSSCSEFLGFFSFHFRSRKAFGSGGSFGGKVDGEIYSEKHSIGNRKNLHIWGLENSLTIGGDEYPSHDDIHTVPQ